jgi:hypothetical protein
MSGTGAERAKENIVPKDVNVTIIPGNPPRVSPDPVYISKKRHEQVVWTCKENFKITMNQPTPFVSTHFTHTTDHSGEPILTPDEGREMYFKYSVEVGGHVADPGVIVNP